MQAASTSEEPYKQIRLKMEPLRPGSVKRPKVLSQGTRGNQGMAESVERDEATKQDRFPTYFILHEALRPPMIDSTLGTSNSTNQNLTSRQCGSSTTQTSSPPWPGLGRVKFVQRRPDRIIESRAPQAPYSPEMGGTVDDGSNCTSIITRVDFNA